MSIFAKKSPIHAKDLLLVLRRRWKMMLVLFVVSLTISGIYNATAPAVFRSKATLVYNPDLPQAILGSANSVAAEVNEDLNISTQLWIIRSDTVAEAVLRRLNSFSNLADEEKDQRNFNTFVSDIRRNIRVQRIEGTRLFEIEATSGFALESANIANAAAEVFVEQSLQTKFDSSRKSISWLTEQIIQMRKKLEQAEQALLDYQKKENIEAAGVTADLNAQRLSEIQTQFIENQNRINDLQDEIDQVKKALESERVQFFPTGLSETLDELSRQLTVAELELEKARSQYREKHPRVLQMRDEIRLVQDRVRAELKKILKNLEAEYATVVARDKVLGSGLESLNKMTLEGNEKHIQQTILRREVDTYRELYNMLVKKMKAADLTRGVGESNFRILEYAKKPPAPVSPNRFRNMVLGIIAGIFLGLAMAILFEYLDRTIHSAEDIELALDLPVLVSVPKVRNRENQAEERFFMIAEEKQTPESEAFHALRTNIRFTQDKQGLRTILFTSTSPSEGKTTVVTNLGISFASAGFRTLIVDGDLRKPRIHTIFDRPNDRGLSNCTDAGFQSFIQKTDFEHLEVLTSGPHSSSPFEVLESEKTKRILRKCRDLYEIVLIDSPPIGSVVDSSVVATYAEGVIFVVESGRVDALHVKHAIEQLEKVQANLLGVVLNSIERESSQYYYSYYYRGYYGDKTKDILKGIKDSITRV